MNKYFLSSAISVLFEMAAASVPVVRVADVCASKTCSTISPEALCTAPGCYNFIGATCCCKACVNPEPRKSKCPCGLCVECKKALPVPIGTSAATSIPPWYPIGTGAASGAASK